jgi:hypothetical protein
MVCNDRTEDAFSPAGAAAAHDKAAFWLRPLAGVMLARYHGRGPIEQKNGTNEHYAVTLDNLARFRRSRFPVWLLRLCYRIDVALLPKSNSIWASL